MSPHDRIRAAQASAAGLKIKIKRNQPPVSRSALATVNLASVTHNMASNYESAAKM